MIAKLIWDILKSDSVDGDSTAIKAQLIAKYSKLTTANNLVWAWTSLKSLLAGTGSDWAKKKIIYQQEENQNLQTAFESSELPIITISQTGSFNAVDTQYFGHETNIEINIYVQPNETTTYSSNQPYIIYKRIKELLFPFVKGRHQYCAEYPELGINSLFIELVRLDACFDRHAKFTLKTRFTEI